MNITGPRFVGAGAVSASAGAVSLTPAKSSLVATDHGLQLAVVAIKSNDVITTATGGWVKLYQDNSGASFTVATFIGTPSAAAPVLTWAGSVGCVAQTAYYDDPANPIEAAIVGATSVGTGVSTALTTASINTTRPNSVVVALAAISAFTSLTDLGGVWTTNVATQGSGANITFEFSDQGIASSGAASGISAQTAGTSAAWAIRQIELLSVVNPTGSWTIESEFVATTQVGNGLRATEVEVAPIAQVGVGARATEVEIAPIAQVGNGARATEFEIVAVLIPGIEPPIIPPTPQVSRVKAWTYSLDGHDMYVLRLGDDTTMVYDLTTQQWATWDSEGQNTWRAALGTNWLDMSSASYLDGVSTNIVIGDDAYGLLWVLDPGSGVDENPVIGEPLQPYTRVVTGGVPMRQRQSPRCNAVFLTISTGQPDVDPATINLRFSDNNGATFTDAGNVVVPSGNYFTEVSWRSLGLIRAPGRVFEFTDTGATVRIDGANVRLSSETD